MARVRLSVGKLDSSLFRSHLPYAHKHKRRWQSGSHTKQWELRKQINKARQQHKHWRISRAQNLEHRAGCNNKQEGERSG